MEDRARRRLAPGRRWHAGGMSEDEVDRAYSEAYRLHPMDEQDEWGDLVAFLDGAVRS